MELQNGSKRASKEDLLMRNSLSGAPYNPLDAPLKHVFETCLKVVLELELLIRRSLQGVPYQLEHDLIIH